ncbi:prepilin-type N-terminal cleavage/methylation domain-containing protein [Yersinia vastinensis]|uniref:prepilin-type N-terminal cleavage/methylation domain-containing protein n=1 Tax=Yersinia TaxID=629 RepID=UPI0005EA1347|nr:prepilin peptidase dependent protein C [Yersinia frederiksenii]
MYLLKAPYPRLLAKSSSHPHGQQGFSLPEVLIAALFFTVSLLGLLQYHQALLQGFSALWQQRQAWSWLNQHIESGADNIPSKQLNSELAPNWHYQQSMARVDGECTELNFTLTIPPTRRAKLSRWFCS